MDMIMVLKVLFSMCLAYIGKLTCATSYPHIITQGTHYETAKDIGGTFREQIQQYFLNSSQLQMVFLPWSKTANGKKILEDYYLVLKDNFPQYLREMQGISDGAGVPLMQVLMMTYQTELSAITGDVSEEPESCTDIYLNLPHQKYISIGHNEDAFPSVRDLGYFVTAYINDTEDYPNSKIKVKEESFTHFTYPGVLPGLAFGFNGHGITQTINNLYPSLVGYNKIGQYVLTRATLSAKSIDEVISIMEDIGSGIAYGISLNVGILPTKDNQLSKPQLWNIEVAPTEEARSEVNVKELSQNKNNENYYHVNIYKRIKISQNSKKLKSSLARERRIQELFPIKDNTDILDILGDTKNKKLPIYRTPRPSDPVATAATGLFDFVKKTMDVYKDNPKYSKTGPVVRFSLEQQPT